MSSDSQPHYKFYKYYPSLAGACVFAVIFGVTTIWHAVLIVKHRTWYFIPLLLGGIFEVVGYACRVWSNRQAPNPTIGPYIVNTLLILVAPALFAASIYMILGRIIASVDGESLSLIKKRWLTKVFVTSDVVTFIVQLGGAGLLASSNPSQATLGSHIILAALALQIIIFGFFIIVALVFHRRLLAAPTSRSHYPALPWKKYLYILYITCGFILLRSILRVAEFVEGFDGEIYTHEVFLFVFDGIPMVLVMGVFNIWYPSFFSRRAKEPMVNEECLTSNVELPNTKAQSMQNT